ncbi:hypothetical protein GCM10009780_64570 [Actinomadura alba]
MLHPSVRFLRCLAMALAVLVLPPMTAIALVAAPAHAQAPAAAPARAPVKALPQAAAPARAPAKALPKAAAAAPFKALVFSKTAGFRHDSIPDGIAAIQKLGQENNFTVDATEDDTKFTDENLAQYQVVIFLSTTGDPLSTQAAKDAFQRYIQRGGGFAGIHAASDGGYSWPWYGNLVGAYFKSHPATQQATVKVEDSAHPATNGLPTKWTRTDEWYDFQTNPRGKVHVLASLDETSYSGGTMGADHPVAWCQDYDGGRSWYTALAHTKESFTEPEFLHHLLGGIQTAADVISADCSASQDGSFDKVTLDDSTSNPMMLDIAADGRVFYIDRLGDVKVVRPSGGTVLAGHLNVFTANESGLLGIALDPAFATNHFVYLFHSPTGSENVDRLSRFTVNGDTIDLASEKTVMDVPVQRAECCHHGGGMVFDKQTGDLWIATGDNTNPFASDGYTPIDERSGRAAWDAQRSSGNTNSLTGKVLRIHPEPDGTYTIPNGNLFPPGTAQTRPEIYAMGFRNPFRVGIDPKTHKLMVANYGPDAGSPSATRGPQNTVEWEILNKPGNYGWPYCVGNNTPYIDYNFATGQSGAPFNCANPVNNSPNNTGLTNLPPAIPADVYYHYNTDPAHFPELQGGAPMAGPVYRFNENVSSARKWPAYWDGKAIFGEWNNSDLFSFQLNEDGSQLVKINQIFKSFDFKKPMDMKFGPDGALYMIEWGSGFGGDNADSGIYRIDYVQGNRPPIARVTADKTDGPAPLAVQFSSEGSRDPDGTPVTYAWDFDGDGDTDSTEADPSHTYAAGNHTAVLKVTDATGESATASVAITAGNNKPTITVDLPPNGGFFDWGDQVKYKVTVTDPEDGTIDCDQVQVQAILGHDSHGHPLDQYQGCSGTVQTTLSSGHNEGDNLFYVLEATYTDHGGAGGSRPLTGRAEVILQPKHMQAEFYSQTGRVADAQGTGDPGVTRETTGDSQGGGQNIGFIEDGDWWSFDPASLSSIDAIRFRAASGSSGGTVEVREGSPTGPVVATATIPVTGAWQTYQDVTVNLTSAPGGSGSLYFVARRPAGSTNTGGVFNVNWVDFLGRGVTDNQRPNVTVAANPNQGTAPLPVSFSATATDPDGDTPLTYKWDFGVAGAPEPTTPEASHTYTTPGTYTASVTVTDAKGAATKESVSIKVNAPNVACLSGRSDDFLGDSLDRDRWSVIRENQDLRVSGGNLVIPTSNTDIYGTQAGDTPNIVVQPAPAGAWTATAKANLVARDSFQQAGLVLYGDDDNYAKMVFQARGTNDANARVFQFIREEAGNPNEVAASNTANLGTAYPDTVYVRFVSDGTNLTAWYSADGANFTKMPETKALAGITNPQIGLISLSGHGARPVVDAAFDWFQIAPDDTAEKPAPSDEFNGTKLDGCRWDSIVRPDPSAQRVTGGNLEIDTSTGDIYSSPNSGPKNFILQKAPSGDWTMETKVDGSAFNQQYQQGGLLVYVDDGNYVKFDYITDNTVGSPVVRRIELRSESGDVVQDPQPSTGNLTQGVWHLRLVKQGNTYHGFMSADGQSWTEVGTGVTNSAVAADAKIGLFAFGVNQTQSVTAKFDYFHLVQDNTAPTTTATADPANPNGANGWYTGPVTVSLAATDDGTGVARTEYQLDGGAWTAYTEPVTVSGDGSHTVAYRSADKAGNVETARTLAIKIDAIAPLTTAAFAPANDAGWHAGAVPVTLSATDATSGIDATQYKLDGGGWTAYTGSVDVTGDGEHTLLYRSTDKAGNVETEKAATITVDATKPTVLVSGVADGQLYGDSQDVRITWQATDATSGIASVGGTLDDKAILSGTLQALYELPLGRHRLAVTATDKAGNTTQIGVEFFTATSLRDIANLIDRFRATGRLTQANATALQNQLTKARKLEAKGDDSKAIKELEKFKQLVNTIVGDTEVKDTLIRDTNAMIVRLGGRPSGLTAKQAKALSGDGTRSGDPTQRRTG